MNKLDTRLVSFENIKHVDDNGNEYWKARELSKTLNYSEYRKFTPIIEKAKITCLNSGQIVVNHFAQVVGMIKIAKGATRKVEDYKLSRYACYLIAQNADSRKEVVALAQTYFAVQTRRQELLEKEYNSLTETEKRFYQRVLTKKGNYLLNQAAKKSGVKNFDRFHNAGYKGLYNGETADDIAKRKGLRYREDILDNMCSDELIANLFRISQTEQKLRKDNVSEESVANNVHYNIGKNIREVIIKNDGTKPEEFETPKKSLKELKKSEENIFSVKEESYICDGLHFVLD